MVTTIGEILSEAARRFGNKISVIVEGDEFSFADMDAMSNKVANGLVSIGVLPGDRVTLYGPNCWQWVVGYYAIAKAGAVANPISAMLTTEEVRYVVEDSGARVLITSSDKGVALLDLVDAGELSHIVMWGDDLGKGGFPCRRGSRRVMTSSCCGLGTRPISERSATPPGRPVIPRAPCRASAPWWRRASGPCSWARGGRGTGYQLATAGPCLRILCAERSHAGRFHAGHGAALRRTACCPPSPSTGSR